MVMLQSSYASEARFLNLSDSLSGQKIVFLKSHSYRLVVIIKANVPYIA